MTEIKFWGDTYRGTAEGDHGVFTDNKYGRVYAGQIAGDAACVGVATWTDGNTFFVECDADGKEHGRELRCDADGDTFYRRYEHGSVKESAALLADGTCEYNGEACRADHAPFAALQAMVVPIKALATTHADKAKKAVAEKKAAEEEAEKAKKAVAEKKAAEEEAEKAKKAAAEKKAAEEEAEKVAAAKHEPAAAAKKAPVHQWTVDDVCAFFAAQKLGEYNATIEENGVDGLLLEKTVERHALGSLGITNAFHVIKIEVGLAKIAQHLDDGSVAEAVLTFGSSKYKRSYGRTSCPAANEAYLVLAAVTKIVAAWARQNNVSDGARDKFLQLLRAEWTLNEPIGEMAQKVWTSQHVLDGLEFCSMFNSLVRGDCKHDDELADDVARFAHAINSNVVTRGVGGVLPWPDGPTAGANHNSTEKDTTWRGGGFHGGFRAFFVPKKVYRVGGFLATSYKRDKAQDFIRRVIFTDFVNECVLWRIELDPVQRCNHVNLVTATHVPGEFEFLFSAYSAFEVVRVHWSPTPQDKTTPHEITLRAAPDNRAVPEDVPLAPWS